LFILSEFEWKSTAIEPLDHDEIPEHDETPDHDGTPQGHKSPHLLGKLNLEITLTKRLPPIYRGGEWERSRMVNAGSLTDEAFRPKKFTVRIEQGKFDEPAHVIFGNDSIPKYLTWSRRLVFNISPYPPSSEWKETRWKSRSGLSYWDCKEFVSKSPEMEESRARRAAAEKAATAEKAAAG
jgi:hypothetical protein